MRASFCSGFLFRVDSRDLAKKKPVVNNSLLPGAKPNAYELEKICSVDCWCCSRHRACARSDPENPTLTKGQSRYDDPTDQFRLCRRRIHSREIHLRWRGRFAAVEVEQPSHRRQRPGAYL